MSYGFVHDGATFTPSGRTDLEPSTVDARNRELSRQEVAAFIFDAPGPYFAYASIGARVRDLPYCELRAGERLTTWMGDDLATITWAGDPFRCTFGDRRQNFRALGINGATYYGTAYLSAGDYVRMRPMQSRGD